LFTHYISTQDYCCSYHYHSTFILFYSDSIHSVYTYLFRYRPTYMRCDSLIHSIPFFISTFLSFVLLPFSFYFVTIRDDLCSTCILFVLFRWCSVRPHLQVTYYSLQTSTHVHTTYLRYHDSIYHYRYHILPPITMTFLPLYSTHSLLLFTIPPPTYHCSFDYLPTTVRCHFYTMVSTCISTISI